MRREASILQVLVRTSVSGLTCTRGQERSGLQINLKRITRCRSTFLDSIFHSLLYALGASGHRRYLQSASPPWYQRRRQWIVSSSRSAWVSYQVPVLWIKSCNDFSQYGTRVVSLSVLQHIISQLCTADHTCSAAREYANILIVS